jgi:hypothetical protein
MGRGAKLQRPITSSKLAGNNCYNQEDQHGDNGNRNHPIGSHPVKSISTSDSKRGQHEGPTYEPSPLTS